MFAIIYIAIYEIIIYMDYSTAHVQVYKKTQVMICASRNFAFNSRVGLVRHETILLASDN